MSKEGKQKKLTISLVPYPYVPPKNGGHYYAFYISKYLDQVMNVEHLGSADNICDRIPFSVKSVFKESKLKYISPLLSFLIWKKARQEHVQHLIVHQPFMGMVLLPVFLLTNTKVYVVVHNIEHARFATLGKWWAKLLKVLELNVFKAAEGLFFISTVERQFAIEQLGLPAHKCHQAPYGTNIENPPIPNPQDRQDLITQYGLEDDCFVMLFFGPMGYKPNLQAVKFIVEALVPKMREQVNFHFHVFICGGGLPEDCRHFGEVSEVGMLGYVPEIEPFIKGADLVLNPIFSGGGVKTKVIEALSLGKKVLSFETGALGIDQSFTGDQLLTVEDLNVEAYLEKIIAVRRGELGNKGLPQDFYEQHNWKKIALQIKAILS